MLDDLFASRLVFAPRDPPALAPLQCFQAEKAFIFFFHRRLKELLTDLTGAPFYLYIYILFLSSFGLLRALCSVRSAVLPLVQLIHFLPSSEIAHCDYVTSYICIEINSGGSRGEKVPVAGRD